MERTGHLREVQEAFTRQARSFAASEVARSEQLLDALLDAARPAPGERWLDAACGPGIVTRALAGRAGQAHGIDTTEAMVQLARDAAQQAGIDNATFAVDDATRSGLADASWDGAVTRFSLHHIPVPARLLDELARVVRPGARIVVLDHLADDDAEARSWVQEVERLRDRSHWASLSPAAMTALGRRAGLTLLEHRDFSFELDFDDWLNRGSQDATAHALVEDALQARPQGTERFTVTPGPVGRTLRLRMWLGTWSRDPGNGARDRRCDDG
ncbi:MAG TPA: methyltransferase domain-containing protein [Solirubrobacteraceae bacterium]|nr:methyltransferase domain-containing protein [Solirubrobacteraceae bacterium]